MIVSCELTALVQHNGYMQCACTRHHFTVASYTLCVPCAYLQINVGNKMRNNVSTLALAASYSCVVGFLASYADKLNSGAAYRATRLSVPYNIKHAK
jgi:hypothetical protein